MSISTETIRKITVQGSGQQSLDALAASLERVKVAQEKVDKAAAAGVAAQEKAAKATLAVAAAQEKLEKSGGSAAAQEKLIAAQERSAKASAAVFATQERMAAAQAALTKATSVQAGVTDTAAKKQLSAAEAYRNQTMAIDANARMQDVVAKKVAVATAAFNQGILGDVNSAAAKAALATRIEEINNKYGHASVAARAYAAATSSVTGQLTMMSAGAGPVGTFLSALGPWGIAAAVGLGVAGAGMGLLVAKSTEAVEAFKKFEEHALTLNSMLKSTGFAAGKSADDIERMATEIGNISEVRKAGIELVKFGSISGEIFERTMVAADDLSAAGFGTISSAALALGKALESPADGLTRLRRAGIIFNDSQIASVKNMQETGRLAEAQKFILDELAKKVGGAGAARDQGLAGSYEALGDATQRLLERWGRQITTGLGLTAMIKGLAVEIDKANTRVTPEAQLAVAERNLAARTGGVRNMGVNRGPESMVNRSLETQKAEVKALRLVVANKEIAKSLEASELAWKSHDAAMERSQEIIKGTVRELEKEADGFRKSAFERAVDVAARKAEVAPGSAGEGDIKRAVNTKMATEATEQFIESTRLNAASLKIEATAMGMSAGAAARYKVEQELLARETAKGVTLSPEQRASIKAIAAEYGSATAAVEGYKAAEAKRAQLLTGAQGIETAKLELSLVGQNAEVLERQIGQLRVKQQLEQESLRTKIPVDQAHLKLLQDQVAEEAKLNQGRRVQAVANEIKFDRDTAWLSPEDVQIAQQLRGIYGNDIPAALGSWEAAQMRIANQLKDMKGYALDFGSALNSALASGKSPKEAIGAGVNAVGSKLSSNLMSAGIATGDPLMMAASIGISMLQGAAEKAKKAKADFDQAVTAWQAMATEVAHFTDQLNGKNTGSLGQSISDMTEKAQKYADAAHKAGQEAYALNAALIVFVQHATRDFIASFDVMVEALNQGLGTDSPAVKAGQSVKQLGDTLKGFIDDTVHAGQGLASAGPAIDAARAASQSYALSLLQTAPALSETETAILTLRGTARQLQTTLQDLGMSSDAAGQAIATGIGAALDDIAAKLTDGLTRQLNDASGKGYINQLDDLVKATIGNLSDADLTGVDTSLVANLFMKQAQGIIDGAGLVGESFTDLTAIFPELNGVLGQSQKALSDFSKDIDDFLNSLKIGDLSTLSPEQQLAAAQATYQSTLAGARGGDPAAQGKITDAANSLLTVAKSYFASSGGYSNIFAQVSSELGSLSDIAKSGADTSAALGNVDTNTSQTAKTLSVLRGIQGQTAQSSIDISDSVTQLGQQAAFVADAQGSQYFGPMNQYLAAIETNTRLSGQAAEDPGDGFTWWNPFTWFEKGGVVPNIRGAYEPGGIVGNGMWGKDSVLASYAGGGHIALAGQEGILTSSATQAIGGASTIDYINSNDRLPAMFASSPSFVAAGGSNDNRRNSMEVARAISAAVAAQTESLTGELAALRAEMAKLVTTTRQEANRKPRPGSKAAA